jgi:hypothetical protein
MNKPNLSKLIANTKVTLAKHSPEILTGIGIAGMITTTVLAVKATPKAMRLIDQKKKEEDLDELTPVEVVKTAWKPYIPAAVTGVTSIACLVGASAVNTKRNAVLATAYTLSETALKEYKDKVVETIGEKKEQTVREKINQEHLDKAPYNPGTVIMTGNGTTECLDYHSGRYFKSDKDHIERAVNELNKTLLRENYVSLNQFYDELDLDHTELGYDLGWNLDDGLIEIDFSSLLKDGRTPILVMNYHVAPHHKFDTLAY